MSENPKVQIMVLNVATGDEWTLDAEYVRSETEGELFDTMAMQLEAIASREGMAEIYRLLSADICKVTSVTKCRR